MVEIIPFLLGIDLLREISSFSCSTRIERKIACIGSRVGTTVHDDACSLALFIRLSKAALSSPRSALRKSDNSPIIPSSSIRKLGIVLPMQLSSKFLQSGLSEGYNISQRISFAGYPYLLF